MGERIGAEKVRFVDCNKDSLIKQSKTRNSFASSHKQTGIQPSLGKQGSLIPNGYLGRQKSSFQVFPHFFPQLCRLSMTPYDTLSSAGVSCVPTQILVHTQPPVKSRKGLGAVQAVLTFQKSWVKKRQRSLKQAGISCMKRQYKVTLISTRLGIRFLELFGSRKKL